MSRWVLSVVLRMKRMLPEVICSAGALVVVTPADIGLYQFRGRFRQFQNAELSSNIGSRKTGACMKRRDFMMGLGAAASSYLPYAVHAEQPGGVYRLSVFSAAQKSAPHIAAFFDELQKLGFVDG